METGKRVIVLLSDLIFRVKIDEAAKRAGLPVEFTDSPQRLEDLAMEQPSAVILDLNFAAGQPLETIRKLKEARETRAIPLLGYVSHVQAELKSAALEAGCDTVIARSAFVQNLPVLLAGIVSASEPAREGL